jgi:hypothetical protein
LIFAFLAAFRVCQDYVLSPCLLSKGAKLHPVVVIFESSRADKLEESPAFFCPCLFWRFSESYIGS